MTHSRRRSGEDKGSWLQGVPRWQAGVGFDYSQPVAGVVGFFSMDGHWVGPAHQSYNSALTGFEMPEYFLLGLNLGVTLQNWQVSLFARNLLNNDKFIAQGATPPYASITLRPRTIGLTVQGKL